jgi:ABC-type amino acid transport substrate-binding protein
MKVANSRLTARRISLEIPTYEPPFEFRGTVVGVNPDFSQAIGKKPSFMA